MVTLPVTTADPVPPVSSGRGTRTLVFRDARWTVARVKKWTGHSVLCELVSVEAIKRVRAGASGTRFVREHVVVEVPEDELVDAADRPWNFYRWHRATRGAFERGMRDAQAGVGSGECPYPDFRKPDGRLSWSRSFRTAWQDGFSYVVDGRAPAASPDSAKKEFPNVRN